MGRARCSTCDWWESEDSVLLNGLEQARCLYMTARDELGLDWMMLENAHCENWSKITYNERQGLPTGQDLES